MNYSNLRSLFLLNTFVPAVLCAWGASFLLLKPVLNVKLFYVRLFARIAAVIAALFIGIIGGSVVFGFSLWAMESSSSAFDGLGNIINGAFVGTFYLMFSKKKNTGSDKQ